MQKFIYILLGIYRLIHNGKMAYVDSKLTFFKSEFEHKQWNYDWYDTIDVLYEKKDVIT